MNELIGVSCVTAASCMAVGVDQVPPPGGGPGGRVTLAERWDGTRWSIVPSQNTGAASDELDAVSCVSAMSCFAVGATVRAPEFIPTALIEHWNGQAWTIVPPATPAGATQTSLSGVSCTDSANCVAVGFFSSSIGVRALVERWDGTRWTVESTQHPGSDIVAELAGVSCMTRDDCWAVGFSVASPQTRVAALVEHWNGARWGLADAPSPEGTYLSRVACAAANHCFAVGTKLTGPSAINSPFIERWDGRQWSVVTTPALPGAVESGLRDISCTRGRRCVAVGFVDVRTTVDALIERSKGNRWAIVASPALPGPTYTELNGVSCAPDHSGCFAVGDGGTIGFGHVVATLTERSPRSP